MHLVTQSQVKKKEILWVAVNLLGACTTSLNRRELLVIVEYCRYRIKRVSRFFCTKTKTFIKVLQVGNRKNYYERNKLSFNSFQSTQSCKMVDSS
jgi:hypothetical protein